MNDRKSKLPDSELEVMQVLWCCDAPVPRAVVEEEMAKIHPMAQTTLLTLLSRLAEKGFLRIEKQGRSSVYIPLVAQKEYQARQSKRFFEQLFGGNMPAFASALSASGISREDLDELRKLLEEDRL